MSIREKEAYNPRQLGHLDEKLRGLVDQQYDFCLYKCVEKSINFSSECKA